MKTIGVVLHERYSLFERLIRGAWRHVALAFLCIYEPNFLPFIVLICALNFLRPVKNHFD